MSKSILTQIYLKEILTYDPDTGVFEYTGKKKWCPKGRRPGHVNNKGYHSIMIDGVNYRSHRLAWLYTYGEFPDKQIDHENHIRSDNRLINLKLASNQDNQKNRRFTGNSSGIMGVCWVKARNKWLAHIKVNQELINIGKYETLQEAASARLFAESYYGFHPNHGINLTN